MKVLLSWIRDFVDVPGTAEEIGRLMSLRGLALEGIEEAPGGTLPPGRTDSGPDAVMDFEVTANRPDCLSVLGLAREIACAYRLPLRLPSPDGAPWLRTVRLASGTVPGLSVRIDDPERCARYIAARATVSVGPSPAWMQARLQALGVRAISNIVDVTNYVLLELGQPLHAFDRAHLADSAIVVRVARPGETLVTLDGKSRTLDPETLVIADAERAAAIGGVMGGAESEVRETTREIVLEAAWFKPTSIRATSKRLGLRTEASYRFERGGDLAAPALATARACALLADIGAGTAEDAVIDVYPSPHQPVTLTLSQAHIDGLLGVAVPAADVERILGALGCTLRSLGGWQAGAPDVPMPFATAGAGWQIEVPGWRVDIRRPVDLIEEIGRHYGFEHIPSTFPGVEQAPGPSDPRLARDARVRRALLGLGFSEAITFAFVERAAADPFAGEAGLVALANPLSEKFAVMRPSLIGGLVDAVSHNRRHERRDVRVFEIGTCFTPSGEERRVAMAWTGGASADHWSGGRRDVDFFDIKGVADEMATLVRATPTWNAAVVAGLVDGQSAEIHIGDRAIGVAGLVDPAVAEGRGVPRGDRLFVAELRLAPLFADERPELLRAEPLARFPTMVRDLSIVLDDTLSAESVRGTIRAAAPSTLVSVREFDRYQGKGIPEGRVSLSLRLTFQAPDRTLTDDEVHTAMQRVAAALTDQLAAVQR